MIQNIISGSKLPTMNRLLTRTIGISLVIISIILSFSLAASSTFNVHAQQGGSVKIGNVTGGTASGLNTIGGGVEIGSIQGGAATGGNAKNNTPVPRTGPH
jgi:hypothetical protein